MAELMPDARQLLSDEPEMESTQHYQQLALLVSSLEWRWRDCGDFFIGANLTVYYSHQQLRHREFRGPDFFLVRDVTREPRNSWVVWEEGGRYPDLIIELLSDSTAGVDRSDKKTLYQNVFRTPEYFWFSPATLECAGFRLVGKQYEAIPADARGWRWSEVLGSYLGITDGWLRYFEPDGQMVPSPTEAAQREIQQAEQERQRADQERHRAEQEHQRAEQERQRADQERQRAEQEHQRAEHLAQRLRELGIEPDDSR
jgi:Uma2 family endonuclease